MSASPDHPANALRFRRSFHVLAALREVWGARELIRTLAERDLRVRYKQATLGAAWALLTPIALMLVFSLFIQRVAQFDTQGAPYVLFSYVALIPWSFFSTSVSLGGQSLVANNSLLNKVYCPREVFPLSSILVAAADMVLASTVLVALFALTGYGPRITALWVPVLLVVQIVFTIRSDICHLCGSRIPTGPSSSASNPASAGIVCHACCLRNECHTRGNACPLLNSEPTCAHHRRVPTDDPFRAASRLGAAHPGADVALLLIGFVLFKRLETNFADVA